MGDIPLRINDPLEKDAQETLKNILAGTKTVYSHRQDLVDRYEQSEHQYNRVYSIVGYCDKIMIRYITDVYYKDQPTQTYQIKIKLTINDRVYILDLSHSSRFEVTPDEPYYEIHL